MRAQQSLILKLLDLNKLIAILLFVIGLTTSSFANNTNVVSKSTSFSLPVSLTPSTKKINTHTYSEAFIKLFGKRDTVPPGVVMPFGIIKHLPPPPLILWFAGESNSGGLADNSLSTIPERAPRRIQIFNNTTLAGFDSLDVGYNNLEGHVGLNFVHDLAHGWELQIANRYAAGDFGARKVYIVKTGQGGSTISMWAVGGTYSAEAQTIEPYATAIDRIQAAIHLVDSIHGKMPDVVMLWSLGINDMGIATDATTFKNATKAVFQQFRDDLGIGDFPIITTQFQEINPTYDAVLADIPEEMANVYSIATTGAEISEVVAGAGSHWGYHGMKQIANDLVDFTLSILNN